MDIKYYALRKVPYLGRLFQQGEIVVVDENTVMNKHFRRLTPEDKKAANPFDGVDVTTMNRTAIIAFAKEQFNLLLDPAQKLPDMRKQVQIAIDAASKAVE